MSRRCINPDPSPEFADAVAVTQFWSLVDQDGDCWEWKGDTDRNGYGVFFWRGKRHGAHTLALSFSTGEARLPDLDTCHSCDNPGCVNPAHLRFDTRLSNVHDMHTRGRAARGGRLTPEQVKTIRDRRAAGARQKDLARDFGVSASLISQIVRGHRWANDPGPVESARAQYRKAA